MSTIDTSIPETGTPVAAEPIRANFEAAATDIDDLAYAHDWAALSIGMQGIEGEGQIVFSGAQRAGGSLLFDSESGGFKIQDYRSGVFSLSVTVRTLSASSVEAILYTQLSVAVNGIEVASTLEWGNGQSIFTTRLDLPVFDLAAGDVITIHLSVTGTSDPIPLDPDFRHTRATLYRLHA